MSELDSKYTAQNLMAVHGLRAQAVVHERLSEARQQGDTASFERWQNVEAAISELRRTAAGRAAQHSAQKVDRKGAIRGERIATRLRLQFFLARVR